MNQITYVKITKAKSPYYWYATKIGKVFTVVAIPGAWKVLFATGDVIDLSDCVPVTPENNPTLIRRHGQTGLPESIPQFIREIIMNWTWLLPYNSSHTLDELVKLITAYYDIANKKTQFNVDVLTAYLCNDWEKLHRLYHCIPPQLRR